MSDSHQASTDSNTQTKASDRKFATIAIITDNRPVWLRRLLQALTEQKLADNLGLDILVVDSASQPDTQGVVNQVSQQSPYQLAYHAEIAPGIVAARNKCVAIFLQSQAHYLFFIGDNEWPASATWAQRLISSQQQYNADIITSHVLAIGEPKVPAWALNLIHGKNNLAEGAKLEAFSANNVLICREVLRKVRPAFDQRFAKSGASDYHFALRCQQAGFHIRYTTSPVLEEFPASHATLKWFLRRGFGAGIGFTRSHLFAGSFFPSIFYCLAMAALRLILGITFLLTGMITISKLSTANGLLHFAAAIGTVAGFFWGVNIKFSKR